MKHFVLSVILSISGFTCHAQSNLSDYTENVLLHVLTHELGHAIIREFDLPVLANEEIAADQFATFYLHQMMPERSPEIIRARFQSFAIEDDNESIFSEYPDDIKRAGRMLCFFYGLDPIRHMNLAQELGLAGFQAIKCEDTASEVSRSWRRILEPIIMTAGTRSSEFRVIFGEGPWETAMRQSDAINIMGSLLSSIDWHSRITLHGEHCDKGAGWRRNGRVIRLCDTLIERFEKQATQVK